MNSDWINVPDYIVQSAKHFVESYEDGITSKDYESCLREAHYILKGLLNEVTESDSGTVTNYKCS